MTPRRHRHDIIGMSGRIFVAPHHSTEELERRYKAADDGVERGHLHIIWLLSQGRSAKFVAEVTGYTPTSRILWRERAFVKRAGNEIVIPMYEHEP